MNIKGKGENIDEEGNKSRAIIFGDPQSNNGNKKHLATPISPQNARSRTYATQIVTPLLKRE